MCIRDSNQNTDDINVLKYLCLQATKNDYRRENGFATYLLIATINYFACTRKSHTLAAQALSPSWIKKLYIRRPNLGFPLNWQAWQIPPNLEMPLTWNVARLCSKIIELACMLQTAVSLKSSFLSVNSSLNEIYRKLCFISFQKSEKLVVSLKIQNVNGMCNQRNNERSSDLKR